MPAQNYFLTKVGLDQLQEELDRIANVELPTSIKTLEEARSDSTSSGENLITTAMERVDYLNARLEELKAIVSRAKCTQEESKKEKKDCVSLGSLVRVDMNGNLCEYRIVSTLEANPLAGLISEESVIGQVLLDSKVGERKKVNVNGTTLSITIIDVL